MLLFSPLCRHCILQSRSRHPGLRHAQSVHGERLVLRGTHYIITHCATMSSHLPAGIRGRCLQALAAGSPQLCPPLHQHAPPVDHRRNSRFIPRPEHANHFHWRRLGRPFRPSLPSIDYLLRNRHGVLGPGPWLQSQQLLANVHDHLPRLHHRPIRDFPFCPMADLHWSSLLHLLRCLPNDPERQEATLSELIPTELSWERLQRGHGWVWSRQSQPLLECVSLHPALCRLSPLSCAQLFTMEENVQRVEGETFDENWWVAGNHCDNLIFHTRGFQQVRNGACKLKNFKISFLDHDSCLVFASLSLSNECFPHFTSKLLSFFSCLFSAVTSSPLHHHGNVLQRPCSPSPVPHAHAARLLSESVFIKISRNDSESSSSTSRRDETKPSTSASVLEAVQEEPEVDSVFKIQAESILEKRDVSPQHQSSMIEAVTVQPHNRSRSDGAKTKSESIQKARKDAKVSHQKIIRMSSVWLHWLSVTWN